ncbi:DNA recombination protein RmuC [Flavilitoribacter nigricans]|uniref:DNA recombination protein RmuC n=1 Tax=Flavilitoribacter nigricans (strain ATCC 23147 / DSM 23189 / NBRC 102662 / NCIMB 1420 / SS-2) TaxID=1122177 RepID=A0A2D0NJD5_FLAN2|nr:DNA recombination protein RmuC [Flavilitoribacter nigricans]PHN08548.1 DNA recombination protein RmuC [Flavilitoribacter nigricans DSM 23189 = NBRC 102662]
MENPLIISFLFLITGLVLGYIAGMWRQRMILDRDFVAREALDKQYISREVYNHLQEQSDLQREDLAEKDTELRQLSATLAGREQQLLQIEEKLQTQADEVEQLQRQARVEFENLANRLLEEKSNQFKSQNQQALHDILDPLRERIKSFEDGIEKRFLEETRDRVSLKKEIEHLRLLNQQLSEDANNLATALKGENKTQGDWGEVQLEMLLERAGLARDIHYQTQTSFRDEDGRQKRPDFIINLPDNKHLIIDCKVSLTAYERFFQASKDEKRKKYLRQHIDSLRSHIKDLSGKNYQQLYQINSPDYLLLFVPIEPAFGIALQEDSSLFNEALDQNIVIVTTSTLLATMRTVSYIWKQEKQKRNVLEIARQSGLLYDRFVSFIDDLKAVGLRLDSAQGAYHDAMRKLTDGKKYGDTLVGRAERIRELGAKASKSLPPELLDGFDEE